MSGLLAAYSSSFWPDKTVRIEHPVSPRNRVSRTMTQMPDYLSVMTQSEVVMHQQFTVVIERDLESGWLVGSVAELPGCYTQAPDLAGLERNMREAIQVFLATVGEEDQGPHKS